ncbi:unnamed protein product, partial [Toxocara canis]|uniref:SSD domain-containing protein n=1 Tax=Toxocara canis TaxID=6265 RepID=A0A183VEQ9_TOXCA
FRYTVSFFWIPLLITALSPIGLIRFKEENRIWFLYSPSNAPSHIEHAIANEFFNDRGGKFWVELPITSQDSGNLLRDGYLEKVEEIADFLQFNLSIPCSLNKSGRCSFRDLCSGPCNDNQVRRNGMSCIPYFALSVVFVFMFIFMTSGDYHNEIFAYKNAFTIALYGTLGPLMAIVTTSVI